MQILTEPKQSEYMSKDESPEYAPEEAENTPFESLLISTSLLLMFIVALAVSVFVGGIRIKSEDLLSMEWVVPGTLFSLVFLYYITNFALSLKFFISNKRGK